MVKFNRCGHMTSISYSGFSGSTDINTAEDAVRALLPLGKSAYWLFTLGILDVGLMAILTLAGSVAYAVAETAGWRNGLYRRFSRAKGFYATVVLVIRR
jgi:Mn2+/Fe2+ NRAMP family transporter